MPYHVGRFEVMYLKFCYKYILECGRNVLVGNWF